MNSALQAVSKLSSSPLRLTAPCSLQRAAIHDAPQGARDASRSPSRPLGPSVRPDLKPHFGYDFSHVRVHTDARAASVLPYPVGRSVAPLRVQRQPAPAGGAADRQQAIAEYETDRQRFEQAQTEQFESIGQIIRDHILQAAGFARGQRPTTPDEAMRVVTRWGVTLNTLTSNLPQLGQSLAGQVQGQHASSSVAQQQTSLINALNPAGQQAYQQVLQRVRGEPFWRQYLDTNEVYIFPDLSGTNRYAGYTQTGTGRTAEGLTTRIYIIHISKDRLETGDVAGSVATLIHELSHTVYQPTVLARSLQSFQTVLAELLADHPQISALRQGAPDAAAARETHIRRIRQILYEATGYGEAEIFVHLQQLTDQPTVQVQGQSVPGSRYILAVVEGYVQQLRRIGLPPRLLAGILGSLGRRVDLLYERRIAAAPAGSVQRRQLELSRDQARAILSLATTE